MREHGECGLLTLTLTLTLILTPLLGGGLGVLAEVIRNLRRALGVFHQGLEATHGAELHLG